MEPLNEYANRLTQLPVDLRAEVVVADLLEDGISLDELILYPAGGFKRATGRDIDGTTWVESTRTSQRWLQINLNRSGLYDSLPEGVFHQPTTNNALVDKEDVLQEMEIQHQREQAARQFFLPLEQEFLHQRIRVEQAQRVFLREPQSDDQLGHFWELPHFLTPAQTKRLLYLLPLMHQLAGDLDAMVACFGQLIEERISLAYDEPDLSFVLAATAPLGDWQLGNTAVFDGWIPNEEPTLQLTVFIERSERVADYMPGRNGRQVLDWLSNYLIPLDVSLRIELDTSACADAFLLNEYDPPGRLNFTTYL